MKFSFPLILIFNFTIHSLVAGCASLSESPQIKLEVSNPEVKPKLSLAQQKENLEKTLNGSSADPKVLEDVRLILEAQIYDEAKDLVKAEGKWKEAVFVAKGAFGDIAFNGWIKSYCQVKSQKFTPELLAKTILEETRFGSLSPRMLERELTEELKLATVLTQIVPGCLDIQPTADQVSLLPPDRNGIPANDPLLVGTAGSFCKASVQDQANWKYWRSTLSGEVSLYFDGLVAQCQGFTTNAITKLLDAAPKLSGGTATIQLALEGYSRVIKMKRDAGERDTVAPYFIPLMKLWNNPLLTEQSFGLSRQGFEIKRIEDTLLAARHRGLIGDAELAWDYTKDALAFVEAASTKKWALSTEMKAQLAAYSAEAYHLQAFRLSVEARDWDKAKSISKHALTLENLNSEWTLRLQWSLGLYEYLSGDALAAKKQWEQMLTDQLDESYRPMILYWLSRCHGLLGNASEAEFYKKTLVDDYPLSFYTIVGLKQSGASSDRNESVFRDLEKLQGKLNTWQEFDWAGFKENPKTMELLRRAEFLTAAGHTSYAMLAIDELSKQIDFKSTTPANMNAANYISRLYAASGNWVSGIALISKLAKQSQYWKDYPEQVLVYFPQPWRELAETASKENGVQPEVTLAITRQETGFKADAKSPAFAYGLMQLTQPTAKLLSQRHGLTLTGLPGSLFDPKVNMTLGVKYLNDLKVQFEDINSLIFASYNAGEQAVSSWVERRSVDEDPLIFIELIPYTETRTYVKNVWRNQGVYEFIRSAESTK